MCTCITLNNGDFYFGRNLDLECRFGEQVVITPRNYKIKFKENPEYAAHYGMIGMATIVENYGKSGRRQRGTLRAYPLAARSLRLCKRS